MKLHANQLLDHKYWLLHALGHGGFGEVWLAQDTVLGDHHVAIKFLTASSTDQDKAFLVEMRALAGEQALKRGAWRKAEQAAGVALRISPRLPSAVLLAGRIKLLQHQPDAAFDILKDAAHGPSRNLMGVELGWLYLQRGEMARALSTLSDEVTRNPLNIEAHCLLLECYWSVRRFDEMKRLVEILRAEKCANSAIENAGLLARLGLRELEPDWLQEQLAHTPSASMAGE